jgi:micrococcal nuclease
LPSLLVVLLLVVSGCVSVGTSPLSEGEARQATVTRVVDGDTVDVRFDDGSTDTVRLLGVDSPELDGRNDPGEFEGVPDTEPGEQCLEGAAQEATAFAERHLAGATVEVVTDPVADRRGDYGRLLAYVVLANDTDFNYQLVATGNARVYDSTFSRSDRFYAAEAEAQAAGRGLWRCREPLAADGRQADSPLRVAVVHPDAEGNDHENLGDEYVTFRNAGEERLDLTGWTVRDEVGHEYRFPDGFEMAPGATVTLYTGAGEDSSEALYWGATDAVWNNDGDVVVVTNATGSVVVEYGY